MNIEYACTNACCMNIIWGHSINVTEFWKLNHLVMHETIKVFKFNMVLPSAFSSIS